MKQSPDYEEQQAKTGGIDYNIVLRSFSVSLLRPFCYSGVHFIGRGLLQSQSLTVVRKLLRNDVLFSILGIAG